MVEKYGDLGASQANGLGAPKGAEPPSRLVASPAIPSAEIVSRLEQIERDKRVRIIMAVESGSRAWGFPSPDSDFDVRFIYVKALDDYLSLQPGRDVIEPPTEGLFDFSGWELRKALNLLLKSNAIASEWLESPIVYLGSAEAESLRSFADRLTSVGRLRYHYFHLGNGIWQERLAWRDQIALKKYFYVVRPALVLRHLRTHGRRPPMALSQVMEEVELEPELFAIIGQLIERKRQSREMGMTGRIKPLDDMIERELGAASAMLGKPTGPKPSDIAAGDALFREIVLRDSGRLPEGRDRRTRCEASQSGMKPASPEPHTDNHP